MMLKKRLASEIVTQFHSSEAARGAESHLEKVVQGRGVPDEIRVVTIDDARNGLVRVGLVPEDYQFSDEGDFVPASGVAYVLGLVSSRSEAKRLIRHHAVEINGEVLQEDKMSLHSGINMKVGKYRWVAIQ
jgi:tyrosyl-tRNA synthetase